MTVNFVAKATQTFRSERLEFSFEKVKFKMPTRQLEIGVRIQTYFRSGDIYFGIIGKQWILKATRLDVDHQKERERRSRTESWSMPMSRGWAHKERLIRRPEGAISGTKEKSKQCDILENGKKRQYIKKGANNFFQIYLIQ